MATAVPIASVDEFERRLRDGGGVVALFHAAWHEPCKQMLTLMEELAVDLPDLTFITIDADALSSLAVRFKVSAAPTTITFANGDVIDSIEGALVNDVVVAANRLRASKTTRSASLDVESIVNRSPIMVFMKGSPSHPRCGFSAKLIALLNDKKGCDYGFVDILENDDLREALKEFAQWKTYPQLWVNGKLVGGLDVVLSLEEDGELDEILLSSVEPKGDDRLRALIHSSPVMLFMKGTPTQPKCGFSRQIVTILNRHHVNFSSFDILSDDEVRSGLKRLSQWPTYPQLYVNGSLLGGLDIVAELDDADELTEALAA